MNTAQVDDMALWSLSYGLYILTSHRDGKHNGMVCNTVFQVTSEPKRIAVCVNKKNLTHEYISSSGVFAVSVLDEKTPMRFIGLFGFRSGKDVDKLSQVNFKEGVTGSPFVTDNAVAVIETKVLEQVDVGTHTIFVGEVVAAKVLKEGTPLTYAVYRQVMKGKAPRNAPTYIEKQEPEQGAVKMKYICNVCGYIYDPEKGDPDNGAAPGTAFEDLPDDWVCPVCGASKDEFSKQK